MYRKIAASVLALMFAATSVHAQTGGQGQGQGQQGQAPGTKAEMMPEGQQQGPDPERMKAQQRMREIQRELGKLQEKTLEDNPELKKRADKLDERLLDKMEDLGYENVREDIARLEETMEAMESGDLSQEEMRKRMKEDRELHKELQQAQQEAMQDEEFMESWESDRRTLEEDLVNTMQEEHPRAKELMEEMKRLQAQMQQGIGGGMGGGSAQ